VFFSVPVSEGMLVSLSPLNLKIFLFCTYVLLLVSVLNKFEESRNEWEGGRKGERAV